MVAAGSRVRPLTPIHIKPTAFSVLGTSPTVRGRAEHVRSARVFQKSTCSSQGVIDLNALTVLSILVCPSKSWTALRFPKFENVSSILKKF
jgi:hypothetical protein